MNFIRDIIKDEGFKKIFAILILFLILFSLRSMFNLALFTFIFTFIFASIINFLDDKLNRFVPIKRWIIIAIVYLATVIGLVVSMVKYIPSLGKQLMAIWNQISSFSIQDYTQHLDPRILQGIGDINIDKYISKTANVIMDYIPHIGEFSFNIVIALILSLFIILEKNEIAKFGKKMEDSKVGYFYLFYKELGAKFLNSFGKVLHIQIMVAFINSILSVIILSFLGFGQVIGLGFMIFVLGLIPVVGMIISFIPLSIIAFTIGGVQKMVMVVVLILILHALESYILNPKLMSMKTKIPIFFTFAILMLGENLIGMWGLLVGLPLFIFFLDIIGIKTTGKSENKDEPLSENMEKTN